jgi:hypothetical protein
VRAQNVILACAPAAALHAADHPSEELTATEIIQRSVQANERDWNAGPSFSHQERDVDSKGAERTDRTWQVATQREKIE